MNRSQLTHFLVQMPEPHGKKEIYSWATLSPLFQWSVGKKKRLIAGQMLRIRDRKECSTINRAFMSAPPSLQGHH